MNPRDGNISGPQRSELIADFLLFSDTDLHPCLLLENTGTVIARNGKARRSIPELRSGANLATLCEEPERFLEYLAMCASSREALPAAFPFRFAGGAADVWRCDGGAIAPSTGTEPALVILRMRPRKEAHQNFLRLSERVRQLNAELRDKSRFQADLENALAAQQALLAEVDHRVKNNLQMILAMLSFAARRSPTPSEQSVLVQAGARVKALASVHNLIYHAGNFVRVNAAELIADVLENIKAIYDRAEVHVQIYADSLYVDADMARSLALIANELISNCFRHAFPNGMAGSAHLYLKLENDRATLMVTDDGIGLDGEPWGFGLTLVQALARQIGGELQVTSKPQKVFAIAFPVHGARKEEG